MSDISQSVEQRMQDAARAAQVNPQAINNKIAVGTIQAQQLADQKFTKQQMSNPFIVNADASNIAAGETSLFSDVGSAVTATGASVLTSFWNTGVALANSLGGDYDEINTGELLKEYGFVDSGNYYNQHQQGIDVAGLVIGSIIPGLGGIKALKGLQALAMTSDMRLVSGLGRLAKSTDEIKAALGSIRNGSQKALWTKESGQLIARAAGQGALEGTAFSWAMLATMNQAPTLNDTNLGYFDSIGKHFTTETILGASLGGVVGGAIAGFTWRGGARRALNAIRGQEAELLSGIKSPNSVVAVGQDGKQVITLTGGDKVVNHADDYIATSKKINDLTEANALGTITEADKNITLPALQQRLLSVNNEMKKQIKTLSGDVDTQQLLQDIFTKTPEGMQASKSVLTGAINIRPAMDGLGAFRPSSLDLGALDEISNIAKAVNDLPDGFNAAEFLYANNPFMKNVRDMYARHNDLAATQGDEFLTQLIANDARVFGNTSGTGPINLRRAVDAMNQVSRDVNPQRWAIADSFAAKYGKITADDINAMSPADRSKYLMHLNETVKATDLTDVFTDVHNALFTRGVGESIAKQYPRLVEYLNTNQLTAKYMKNNFSILDTQSGQVFHQSILPTPADFGKPTLQRTATTKNLHFGAYSVEVKPGTFDLSSMSKFGAASAQGLGTKETSALLKSLDEYAVKTNAKYVGASMDEAFKKSILKQDGKTVIGKEDLPYLDSAYSTSATKFMVEDLGEMNKQELGAYIKNLKADKIQEIQNANSDFTSSWSVDHLSRIFNADSNFVELGAINRNADIGQFSLSHLDQTKPRFLKVKYSTDFDKTQPEIDARWQTITSANKLAAGNAAIDVMGQIDPVFAQAIANVGEAMPSVNTIATEQGTSYFAAVNAGFNSYESRMQMIGQLVNTASHKVAQSTQATMLPLTQTILKDPLATSEIGVVVAKARSGKYMNAESLNDLASQLAPAMSQIIDPSTISPFVNKLSTLEQAVRTAAQNGQHGSFAPSDTIRVLNNLRDSLFAMKNPTPEKIAKMMNAAGEKLPNKFDDVWSIKTPQVGEFIKAHMEQNSKYVGMRTQINNAVGKVTRWNQDELYVGAPDIKGKSVAFIESPPTPSGERARHMIIANTPEERNAQIAIINRDYADQGYKVYTDPQMADYKEALAKWEGGTWLDTPEFSADLRSRGVANNFFPRSDGKDAVTVVDDTIKRHTKLIQDTVEARYADDFASLRGMEESWDTMYGKSTKGSNKAFLDDNPARKLRQIGLDLPSDTSKVSSYINNFIESGFNKVEESLGNIFTPAGKFTMDDVNRINGVMKDAGLKTAYANAAELMLANSTAPKQLVRQFVATANAFVSLGMHRLETMMSLINAVGNTILSVPLISTVIRNLPDDVRMANFGVNNSVGVELSVPKFMAQSMKAVAGDYKNLVAKYEGMGLPVSHSRIYSQMMDTLVNEGALTGSGVASYLTKKIQKMGDFAGKYNGSNILTGYNRLMYAHMGERLADMAGAADGLAKSSFINTFITKIEGTMVSSQRPKFFQGLIGQAMGLFQSYNLHLMQQLTGNILDGNARASIHALSLNGTIFGAQSIPGWDELNAVVARHNRDGFGVDTYINDALGNDLGEWLTYGSLSNMLHMGVFTRGRIELGFGLTGDIMDRIPAASMLSNTLAGVAATVGNARQNGLSVNGLLEGLNTMQWNRPMAELAQRALGYTPTKYGDIISYNQKSESLFGNAWSIFGAALGARDLDAAIASSQYYNSKQRKAIVQDRLNDLGSKVKKAVHDNSELDSEEIENFANKYVERGGDLKNFQRWIVSTSIRGQVSQVEKLRKGITSPSGRQAQALMGGAAPDLFNTSLDFEE